MSQDQIVSFSLEINAEPGFKKAREFQTVLYRALDMYAKISPEKVRERIRLINMAIAAANQLRLALLAAQAAAGPIGWAMAGIGFLTGAAATGEVIGELGYTPSSGMAFIDDPAWTLRRRMMGR